MEVLGEYGEMAGLKINKEKTKILVKNMIRSQKNELADKLGIQITKKIRYLGIHLTARCVTIKRDNYDKLMDQIKTDLDTWTNLQLSFMGRIAVIKMNILPKILFLFQCIPIRLEKEFFRNFNQTILKFIWQGKKPRIKLKLLQDAKERGGLGLPDLEKYYQSTILLWVRDWIRLENRRLLKLEGHDMQTGWHAMLWDEKHKVHQYFRRHYVRRALIDVWIKIRRQNYRQVPNWISTLEMYIHPRFIQLGKVITYKIILDERGELKSRKNLQDAGIELEWWAYLQLQARYRQDKKEWGIKIEPTELDKILLGPEDKMIKKIYHFLLDQTMYEEQVKETMLIWSRDFGFSIDLHIWQELWERNRKLTLATSYKENLYKMFYRWHFPPARLAKMGSNISPLCWKCKTAIGSYYHMWWECPKTREYWNRTRNWLRDILTLDLELKPELFLLGITTEKYDKGTIYLLLHILTAARLAFAQRWKSKEIPTEEELIHKILACAEMDRLTMILKDKCGSVYYETWDKFYRWRNLKRTVGIKDEC